MPFIGKMIQKSKDCTVLGISYMVKKKGTLVSFWNNFGKKYIGELSKKSKKGEFTKISNIGMLKNEDGVYGEEEGDFSAVITVVL